MSVGAAVIDGRGTQVSAERNRASQVTAGVSYSRLNTTSNPATLAISVAVAMPRAFGLTFAPRPQKVGAPVIQGDAARDRPRQAGTSPL